MKITQVQQSAATKRISAGRWVYTLKCSKALRDAIEEEDYEAIITVLQLAYDELFDAELIDLDDRTTYIDELDYYDVEDEEIADDLDYELAEFYDLCDAIGVWVEI